MSTTVVPDTIDHLVALFTAAATIGGADPPVDVIDGPIPSSGPIQLALWVGLDDLPGAANGDPVQAGNSDKERNDFGTGTRETFTVPCVAAAWAGSVRDGFSPLRASVSAIVQAVETVLAADPAPPFQQPGVTASQWFQRPLADGLQVYVPFQIIYIAL